MLTSLDGVLQRAGMQRVARTECFFDGAVAQDAAVDDCRVYCVGAEACGVCDVTMRGVQRGYQAVDLLCVPLRSARLRLAVRRCTRHLHRTVVWKRAPPSELCDEEHAHGVETVSRVFPGPKPGGNNRQDEPGRVREAAGLCF